jgi:hypothetical protein
MRAGIILGFAFAVVAPAASACTVNSAADRPHLVELYTSEGCDSCPPAERWMSTLLKHADIAGLEFHADYWDTSDWRDPFSQHAFTERQQTIAKRGNGDQIYTPQIWVDGHIWMNWPKGAPPALPVVAAPSLQMQIDADNTIHVQLKASAGNADAAPDYKLFVALTENGLARDVRGGENRGKHLGHDEVVRAFAGPLNFPRAETTLNPPAGMNRAQATLVAFIQDTHEGSVLQVVREPLNECKK